MAAKALNKAELIEVLKLLSPQWRHLGPDMTVSNSLKLIRAVLNKEVEGGATSSLESDLVAGEEEDVIAKKKAEVEMEMIKKMKAELDEETEKLTKKKAELEDEVEKLIKKKTELEDEVEKLIKKKTELKDASDIVAEKKEEDVMVYMADSLQERELYENLMLNTLAAIPHSDDDDEDHGDGDEDEEEDEEGDDDEDEEEADPEDDPEDDSNSDSDSWVSILDTWDETNDMLNTTNHGPFYCIAMGGPCIGWTEQPRVWQHRKRGFADNWEHTLLPGAGLRFRFNRDGVRQMKVIKDKSSDLVAEEREEQEASN